MVAFQKNVMLSIEGINEIVIEELQKGESFMKNELKFYTSLPLFILTTCIMWGMSLSLIYL